MPEASEDDIELRDGAAWLKGTGRKAPLAAIPPGLEGLPLTLSEDGTTLTCVSGGGEEDGETALAHLVKRLVALGVDFSGIETSASSLEDIFVDLVGARA